MLAAASVFVMAWTLRRTANNRTMLVLGIGLLIVCLVDFGHTLSYQGMPNFVTPSSPEKAINFWLAARFIAALTILAVALLPAGHLGTDRILGLLGAGLCLAAMIYWVGLFRSELLPRTFIEGQGLTAFKVGFEYFLGAIFAVSAILLYRRRQESSSVDFIWLAVAAWVQGLAEMFFTLYADVSDIFNLLGHLYKVIAYFMIYRAVVLHFRTNA